MPVTFTIRDRLFRTDILMCVGKPSDVVPALRKIYGKRVVIRDEDIPDNECSACFSNMSLNTGERVYLIWLEAGCSGGDLVHEIHHATIDILKDHSINPHTSETEELSAYYEGWLYESVFDKLKTITKRKAER